MGRGGMERKEKCYNLTAKKGIFLFNSTSLWEEMEDRGN